MEKNLRTYDYFDGSDFIIEEQSWSENHLGYLNNVEKGGETFSSLNIKPIKGDALIWNNLNYDGMPNKIQFIRWPVISGYKSIITVVS